MLFACLLDGNNYYQGVSYQGVSNEKKHESSREFADGAAY